MSRRARALRTAMVAAGGVVMYFVARYTAMGWSAAMAVAIMVVAFTIFAGTAAGEALDLWFPPRRAWWREKEGRRP